MLYKAFIHGLRYPEQGVLKGSEKRVYYRLLGELVEFGKTEQLFSTPADKRTEDYITGRFG